MINQYKNHRSLLKKWHTGLAVYILPLLCLLFFNGCASMSLGIDSLFILNHLDDGEKSAVITDKGIEMYKLHLEKEEDYQMLGEIKEYFEVALRFNPDNKKAEEYLEKIDSFITTKVTEKIKIAKKLLKKKKRSAKDDYELALAVSKAYELDPGNKDVQELRKETIDLIAELIADYLEQVNTDLDKLSEKDTPVQQSKKYSAALAHCQKALYLDPGNKEAASARESILMELKVLVDELIDNARELISKKDYKGASSLGTVCKGINKASDNAFEEEVDSLTYDLYYTWAEAYLAKKDYKNALSKIRIALYAQNTKEAQNLKKKITSLKQKQDAAKRKQNSAKAMEKSLNEIDSLINQGKYVDAYNKIQSLLKKTKDKNFKQKLNAKVKIINGHLAKLYDKALSAYKQENYKEAIKLLTIIVQIDEKFKQAKDYLEKAVARQELLDSF